jgi:hypothetical protein
MLKSNRILLIFGFLLATILLIGHTPVAATAVSPAEFAQSTPTPESNLPTATANPNMIMPGNYYVGKCANTTLENGAKIKFCVTGVRVNSERHMFFDVSWAVSNVPNPPGYILKDSYKSRDVYLTDNLGNQYDHITGGGEAYRTSRLETEKPSTGWFEFGKPPVDALEFDFHDNIYHMVISGITLIPGFGYIQYDTLLIDQFPMIVKYDKDKWNPTKSAKNANMLTHKTMPTCTIQPKSPSEPAGKFKSLTADGNINYKIYGYFDDAQDLYIREYAYESGIKGLDPSIKPFFYVTIPAEKSKDCIIAVNNVLARLAIPKQ